MTLFYSNCNIDTPDEFARRAEAARRLAAADGVPLVEDVYDHAAWLREAAAGYEDAPEKGARCARCYRFNLARTARYARLHGYEAFTTSLSVSPHKPSAAVFAAGRAVDAELFFADDFKKRDGFRLSTTRASALGLYRQSYCGCEFGRKAQAKREKDIKEKDQGK